MSNDPYAEITIHEQLLKECRAMAEYSLANGLSVPVEVIKTIDRVSFSTKKPKEGDESVQSLEDATVEQLVNAHQVLSELVKPARPRTILLLDLEQKSKSLWNFLGPVSIIRQMMIASFVSLIFFIAFALSPDVKEQAGSILTSSGMPLLKNLLFYLAAAGLGAGFSALYTANSYITQGTFDPTYEASYWIRFFLGLISGLVMSVMVSDNALGSLDASQGTTSSDIFLDPGFLRPMLAMVGGFSANLLYTVLNRLVETLESLFQGSTKTLLQRKTQEAEAMLANNKAQGQIDIASRLIKLQQEIGTATNPADIQAKIDQLLNSVMPSSGKTD